MNKTFKYITDTSSLVIFDPLALVEHLNKTADWWTISGVKEMNAGNLVLCDLFSDGVFQVEVSDEPVSFEQKARLKSVSGKFFIGPGEQIPGEGVLPDLELGGIWWEVPIGTYQIAVLGEFEQALIKLRIWKIDGEARNNLTTDLKVFSPTKL